MAYIGNSLPANFQSLPAVQRFNGNASTTAFTLASAIANDQSILVSVDGVVQDSNAYSVSGTTLTFTAAPSSGTGNIFVNTISPVGSTLVPPDGVAINASTGTFSSDISTSTAGTSNFRAGVNAGNSIQSGGNYNVTVGDEAGTALTTGDDNTFIGYAAGDATTTATDNVAVGHDAFTANSTGIDNVAVGANALMTNTTADANTALGYQALKTNSTGHSNVAVGKNSLKVNTTAHNNTAVGYNSMLATTTGDTNCAFGKDSLKTCTTGTNNTALGHNTLGASTTGTSNSAVGDQAGAAVTTGNENTYIGLQAGLVATTGSNNTAVGSAAGIGLTTGGNNVLLGNDAGRSGSPGGAVTSANHKICIGDENIDGAHIQVDWTVASDERDKTDFTALDLGLDFVKELEPVTYKWDKRAKYGEDVSTITHDGTHKEDWLDVGFKAQAVEALEKAAGHTIADKTNLTTNLTDDGKQYGLTYSKFVPILVKAIQELSEKVAALEAK